MELAPSILTADFTRLGAEVEATLDTGIRWLHLDIMDGRFVPSLSFGPLVIQALSPLAHRRGAIIDAHLMTLEPERYIEACAIAGCDRITVHVEATPHLHHAVHMIRNLGLKAGAAVNPATPLNALEEVLPDLDLVLIMTINPGLGGQRLIPACLNKVRRLRQLCNEQGLDQLHIQVDGGVNVETIAAVRDAGASVSVVGAAVYTPDRPVVESIAALRAALSDTVSG